jgi:heme oxygenase
MESPLAQIRAATAPQHQRLEALPYGRAVLDGSVPVGLYASFLRAIDLIHGELLQALELSRDQGLRAVAGPFYERRALLSQDLAWLKSDPLRVDAASLQALVVGQKMRLAALHHPARLLGHAYVLEGSQLGGLVQQAALRNRSELHAGGLLYLSGGSRAGFGEFTKRLTAALTTEEVVEAAIVGAIEAFEGFEQISMAVDPSHPKRLRLAEQLNPDAGTHAVPDDLREISAALRAGEQSYREVVYYPARYGEHGLGFIRSDSAWLVTLTREGDVQLLRQTAWIGRVLAARGMPRVLLEQHLELLYRALVAEKPEGLYGGLLRGAAALRAERLAALPGFDALVESFADRFGNGQIIPGREAAMLLASAAADEKQEVPNAVESLAAWLCSPSRFSAGWLETAGQLLRAARL